MDISFRDHNGLPVHIDVAGEFKAGDQPPTGYTDWHEWADVQHEAGLRQETCPICGFWKFPQELSDHVVTEESEASDGRTHTSEKRVCLKCHHATERPSESRQIDDVPESSFGNIQGNGGTASGLHD